MRIVKWVKRKLGIKNYWLVSYKTPMTTGHVFFSILDPIFTLDMLADHIREDVNNICVIGLIKLSKDEHNTLMSKRMNENDKNS